MKSTIILIPLTAFILLLSLNLVNVPLNAQCTYTNFTPAVFPDECGPSSALNLSTVINTCQKVCIDMSQATASSNSPADPVCGSGTITNDIWLYTLDPYNNIPNYDGSWVFAWKDYPGFPITRPTVYTHLEFDGAGYLSIIPVFSASIDCSDGFSLADGTSLSSCADTSAVSYDNQSVLGAGSIPTNNDIEQLIIDAAGGAVTSADITSIGVWTQIDAFPNMAGEICFELSTYSSGYSCGDPNILTFSGTGTSETQTINNCLCNSAQNGGYYGNHSKPCTGGEFTGTTAFYQINAPYDCNQISASLQQWGGSGEVNISILGNLSCPDVIVEDENGGPPSVFPGLEVDMADVLASECTSLAGTRTVITDAATCLPAGTYYVVINGNADKSDFEIDIEINEPATSITFNGKVFLEGAYDPVTSSMSTNLSTSGDIALSQPYFGSPWNYAGTEGFNSLADMPSDVVDWVLVKALSPTSYNQIETRAGLLLNDGSIVAANGSASPISFNNITPGETYVISVEHRNHLAILSANAIALPNTSLYDFSVAANVLAAASQTTSLGGTTLMLAGDMNSDGAITYADFNYYLNESFLDPLYPKSDCDLSGLLDEDDFILFLNNVGRIGIDIIRY